MISLPSLRSRTEKKVKRGSEVAGLKRSEGIVDGGYRG